ncbi:type I polyketide synthase [Corallococcus terminator]|uniref:KR domain-containing protein n=1 Tax=Corallococcus terminator TaxID=2316733 RepID=A0A3A8J8E0_9BACT|nr:type I polyketide synthase [Corallococcus terminator]RKG92067.1 KR domain-containing protein [Corallococcus terminator]
MLRLINRYAHGFVSVPVIVACKQKGLFSSLEQPKTLESLAEALSANSGHLQAALRMLHALGWLSRDEAGTYQVTPEAGLHQQLPSDLLELSGLSMARYLSPGEPGGPLSRWIARSRQRWDVTDPLLADLLDGVLLVPLLSSLGRAGPGPAAPGTLPWPVGVSPPVREELDALFLSKGWAEPVPEGLQLTDTGRFLTQRGLIAGTTASYAPMLARMPELLFGDAQAAFERAHGGAESHVDRTTNVVASGFQHERFFQEVDDVVLAMFDRLPLEAQPRYVIDMGCGDGTFLLRIHALIRSRTARGQHLEQHPVLFIGADVNEAARAATAKTLAEVPHLVVHGDIGDPARLMADLRALGLPELERTLHVRSFLDHDRPYIPPARPRETEARARLPLQGVYVDPKGALIPPGVMFQSLVEHFQRWADVVTEHGLLLLEVHSLPPETVHRFLDQCENLHFDAYHAFSKQYLVEPHVFLLAAAEAGLFPKLGFPRRSPRTFPFTRITLSHFEKRPYTVRHARLEDLPALLQLEEACMPPALRASERQLRSRLEQSPDGNLLLELEGRTAGVVYSQRITDESLLARARHSELGALHAPGGALIQLLGLNVLPEMQRFGLGDQLLEFMLQHCTLLSDVERVVGITRCRDYPAHAHLPQRDYLQLKDGSGKRVDSILRFHEAHGASIVGLVPDYRPEDTDNQGAGVRISYELRTRTRGQGAPVSTPGAQERPAVTDTVEAAIRQVLGERRAAAFAPRASLNEMGLDSLDLMELASLLGRHFGASVESTLFFRHGTPATLFQYFEEQARGGATTVRAPERTRVHDEASDELRELRGEGASRAETSHEPVAIIGMACRFPGGATSPAAYWSLLHQGTDAISAIPHSRGELLSLHASRPGADDPFPRHGGFLERIDGFDASFFRISPREAGSIDPQHRLLLEVSWEALENAGLDPESLAGTPTGVFTGIFSHDYESLQLRQQSPQELGPYFATGNSSALASGRLSYFLGLQGPAITVNTACSSSLVAVHLAAQSLRQGECTVALASGVNLLLSPELNVTFAQAGMLSPDGRCKTFDAGANGYSRSEGCGAVILKRLSQALADGDTVLAVLRGTAINQDGASNGLTAPNGLAQEAVIRKALADARVAPAEVSYVEAHGTGTPLGDPVELNALGAVYGAGRTPEQPLAIGSVKTNIGHTEAAAGLAGLLKVVLSLQHESIPRHLHLARLNPQIRLDTIPARIPTEPLPWRGEPGRRRIAGVSAFGFSGTNAHVIVEEAPAPAPRRDPGAHRHHLLALSARSAPALRQLARAHEEALASAHVPSLQDVCFTASTGRAHLDHRQAFVAHTPEQLREALATFASQEPGPRPSVGKRAFLFTGQGAQSVGMARQLHETQPVYRRAFDRCDTLLRPLLGASLWDVLYPASGTSSPLHETRFTQPALFAVEYALAELWGSWGIVPDLVMGHSLGEYVAACVAGVFSLEEGLRLVASRARLMQALPSGGTMMALLAGEEQVAEAIRASGAPVSIAAINGPASVVISGPDEAVRALAATLKERGVQGSALTVSHAFHSALMEPMLAEFERVASGIDFRPPRIGVISNVTGALAGPELTTTAYWCRHVRAPVRFAEGMRTLHALGCDTFLELGPKPTLLGMGRQCLPEDAGVWLPSLRPGIDDEQQLLQSLATLYARGARVDWAALHRHEPGRKVSLPTYPFQRERAWFSTSSSRTPTPRAREGGRSHPLRGRRLRSALEAIQFESTLHANAPAYLAEHVVHESIVLPGAAYLEMVLSAGSAVFGSESFALEDVVLQQAMLLSPEEPRTLQTVLVPEEDARAFTFRISSIGPEEDDAEQPAWTLHVSGRLVARPVVPATPNLEVPDRRIPGGQKVGDFYTRMDARSIHYGPSFQAVEELWGREGEALGRIRLPEHIAREAGDYLLHPVLLDAALQVTYGALSTGTYMPVSIERFTVDATPGTEVWSRARLHAGAREGAETFTVDLDFFTSDGRSLARVEGMLFKRATPEALQGRAAKPWQSWLYTSEWRDQGPVLLPAREGGPFPEEARIPLRAELERLVAGQDLTAQDALFHRLEALSAAYVVQAFQQLGWTFPRGDEFTTSALASRLNVVARHHRLLGRLLEILSEEGVLRRDGARWQVLRTPEEASPETWVGRTGTHPPAVELELLDRCGTSLGTVLRGEQDPLQLLFPEGDLSTTARLYEGSSSFLPMNQLVRSTLSWWLSQRPQKPLRILELGAGSGGTTAHVLPILPGERTEYVFSDVSPMFVSQARERFAAWPFLRGKVLDLEQDPRAQGFEEHSFDLILAANVLHATRELRTSLEHIQRLLAPGGSLVLLEVTAPARWTDLTFGLTEGWWRFTDTELRPEHPLLSAPRWQEVMARSGLPHSEVIALSDPRGGMLSRQAVLLARAGEATAVKPRAPASPWLVLADRGGVADQLEALLKTRGEPCIRIHAGAGFAQRSEHAFEVAASEVGDFERVLRQVLGAGIVPRGVVHLWSLDVREDTGPQDVSGLEEAARHNVESALHLVQALVRVAMPRTPPVWLVTRGAVPAGPSARVPGVAQAPLWGLGKVIALEHPEAWGGLVDLDPEAPVDAQALLAEFTASGGEEQLAFRGGHRYACRLAPRSVQEPRAPTVKADGAYLITGGLGFLGLQVARWLVRQGARHLVLVGRSALSERARWAQLPEGSEEQQRAEALLALEQQGATVECHAVDVGDAEALSRLLKPTTAVRPAWRGVIHSAGVAGYEPLTDTTPRALASMFRPKVAGAWLLHQLTRELDLDFFVCFSSASSTWGARGHASYASANQFLDALAHHRRALGLPALTVNWALIGEGGMLPEGYGSTLRQIGVEAMRVEDGLLAMGQAMATGAAQVTVARVNWSTFKEVYEARRRRLLLEELAIRAPLPVPITVKQVSSASLLQQLAEAPPEERAGKLSTYVQEHVARVLGLGVRQLDVRQSLHVLGLDSLMAIQLRTRLRHDLKADVPVVKFMEGFSVVSLVDLLGQHLTTLLAPAPADAGWVEGEL